MLSFYLISLFLGLSVLLITDWVRFQFLRMTFSDVLSYDFSNVNSSSLCLFEVWLFRSRNTYFIFRVFISLFHQIYDFRDEVAISRGERTHKIIDQVFCKCSIVCLFGKSDSELNLTFKSHNFIFGSRTNHLSQEGGMWQDNKIACHILIILFQCARAEWLITRLTSLVYTLHYLPVWTPFYLILSHRIGRSRSPIGTSLIPTYI